MPWPDVEMIGIKEILWRLVPVDACGHLELDVTMRNIALFIFHPVQVVKLTPTLDSDAGNYEMKYLLSDSHHLSPYG